MPRTGSQSAAKLERAAEALALGAVVLAPLLLGAVHLPVTLGLAFLGLTAAGLLLRSAAPEALPGGWLAPSLLALALLTALWLVPLPAGVIEALAPATADTLSIALGAAGAWPSLRPLSLDPPATAREVVKLLGWAGVALVLQHRATSTREGRRRVLIALAASASVVAGIGLVHAVAGQRLLFWLHQYAGTHPVIVSTFGNPNHLAAFLNVGALTGLGLAAGSHRLRIRVLGGLAFVLCAVASLLAISRGGLVALALGLGTFGLLRWLGRNLAVEAEDGAPVRRPSSVPILAALLLAAALAALAYARVPALREDLGRLARVEGADQKLLGWSTAVAALRAHPLFGLGRGAFESAHPRYLPGPSPYTFTHVENELLQAAAELGAPLAAALLALLLAAVVGLARRGRRSAKEAGAAAAAVALLAHSLVDFNLQFACGLALIALLARARHGSDGPKLEGGPLGRALALGVVVLALACSVRAWPGLDVETKRLAALVYDPTARLAAVEDGVEAALARRPGDHLACEAAGIRTLQEPNGSGPALRWLNCAMLLAPTRPGPHLHAGEALARLGRREQALLEWRMAWDLGRDPLPVALRFYSDRAAVTALSGAEPSRIETATRALIARGELEVAREVVDEALAARPDDPALLEWAYQLYIDARPERALAAAIRLRQLGMRLGHAGALEARALIRLGQPEEARKTLRAALRAAPTDAEPVLALAELDLASDQVDEALVVLAALPASAGVDAQVRAHRLRADGQTRVGDRDAAVAELRLALRLMPEDPGLRFQLADLLVAMGRLDDAEVELDDLVDDERVRALRAQLLAKRRSRDELLRNVRGGTLGAGETR